MSFFELADTLEVTEDDRLVQAEALVRSYCGWHIAPSRTDTITFRGSDSISAIWLPSLHVTAIESVTVDGDLVSVDDYVWSTAGALTWRPLWGWRSDSSFVVEFTHGFDTPPAEVTAVVQALAQRAVANPAGLASWSQGPFSETYGPEGTSGGLLASLSRYKLPPRP